MIRVRTGALAALMSLGLAGTAWAHAHLLSADPGGAVVAASPTSLSLTFSEGLEIGFTGISLTSASGAAIATRAAHLAPGDDEILVIPLSQPLDPGTYTVRWHALSADGHTTHGTYSFGIKP
jgi:methionine-rich copper-binding protein CopC